MVADWEVPNKVDGSGGSDHCSKHFGYKFRNSFSFNYYRQFLHAVVWERTHNESRDKDFIFKTALQMPLHLKWPGHIVKEDGLNQQSKSLLTFIYLTTISYSACAHLNINGAGGLFVSIKCIQSFHLRRIDTSTGYSLQHHRWVDLFIQSQWKNSLLL